MSEPSLASLIKEAVDERAWRDCHLMFQTPHDPKDLEAAEDALEVRIREIVREEIARVTGNS